MSKKVKELESKVDHLEQMVMQLAYELNELKNKDKEPQYFA